MATAAIELPLDEASTDIAVIVERDHSVVLFDQEKFDAWYDNLKANAPRDADVSTNRGREALRSYSAGVRKQKAAIDRDRLRLTSEWRAMTAKVNDAGKQIEGRLDALADEIRKPLTEWEEAEKARVAECRAVIDGIRAAKVIAEEDTAASVRERGTTVYQTAIDPDRFGDMAGEAEAAKADAIDALKRALARLTQEEADRAELEKLRAERAEAERVAAERAAAAEAERQRVAAEREAEDRRASAEKVEAERIARVEQEAADRAKREAEEAAAAERARIQREHDEALAAERARAEEAERKEAERVAEEKRIADEEAKRARNRAHRSQVMGEAKLSIMAAGSVDEDAAVAIVKAIVAGSIPHVSLAF